MDGKGKTEGDSGLSIKTVSKLSRRRKSQVADVLGVGRFRMLTIEPADIRSWTIGTLIFIMSGGMGSSTKGGILALFAGDVE